MNYYMGFFFLTILAVIGYLFGSKFLDRPLAGKYRLGLALLQAIPPILLAWLLIDPRFHGGYEETLPKVVALVVDDSPSMSFSQEGSGESRLAASEEWVKEVLDQRQQESSQAQVVSFQTSQLVPAGTSSSDYASAINGLLQKVPQNRLASVILVGDGQHHGSQSPVLLARNLGFPILTVGIGSIRKAGKTEALWLEVPSEVDPGSPFLAHWRVESDLAEPLPAKVQITFSSEEVLSQEIKLEPPHSAHEDWIGLRSLHAGKHLLELVVSSARTGEPIAQATAAVLVETSTPTILIFEGEPSRLARSFSQAVLHNGRYRLLRPVSLGDGTGILWDLFRGESDPVGEDPWSHEKMIQLDTTRWESLLKELLPNTSMVVLGNNPLGRMPSSWQEALEKHIQLNRTGVLLLPGSEALAARLQEGGLKEVLTLMEQRSPSPGALDLAFPEKSRNHPSLAPVWSQIARPLQIGPDKLFEQTPPHSTFLVNEASGRSLVFETRMGLSHAILVAPENLWTLAAFGGGENSSGNSLLEGLWLGIGDYLASFSLPRKIKIEAHPNPSVVGQPVAITVYDPAIAPGPPVSGLEIKPIDGDWQILPVSPDPEWPGSGRTSWYARQPGEYRLRYAQQEAPQISLKVLDQSSESGDQLLNESLLRGIAEATGGKYFEFADRAQVVADLDTPPLIVQRSGSFPLRHDLRFGAGLAILFCVGWGIRRLLSLP